jgi:hypothetical protein
MLAGTVDPAAAPCGFGKPTTCHATASSEQSIGPDGVPDSARGCNGRGFCFSCRNLPISHPAQQSARLKALHVAIGDEDSIPRPPDGSPSGWGRDRDWTGYRSNFHSAGTVDHALLGGYPQRSLYAMRVISWKPGRRPVPERAYRRPGLLVGRKRGPVATRPPDIRCDA